MTWRPCRKCGITTGFPKGDRSWYCDDCDREIGNIRFLERLEKQVLGSR